MLESVPNRGDVTALLSVCRRHSRLPLNAERELQASDSAATKGSIFQSGFPGYRDDGHACRLLVASLLSLSAGRLP
jgi:hypothetical protein